VSNGPLLGGLSVGLAITFGIYSRVLVAVGTTLFALAGHEASESGSKVLLLLGALTGNAWTAVAWVALVASWAARELCQFARSPRSARDPLPAFLALTFFLYLPAVSMGYARNHVFLIVLLVLLTVTEVERLAARWRVIGEGAAIAAALVLLAHVPLSSPAADRSVLAYSAVRPAIELLARSARPPCLAAEERFLLPLAYYAARGMVLIRRECPDVLLKWPGGTTGTGATDQRLYPEELDRFGVALLDRTEAGNLERAELDETVAWIRYEVR
jgi:hypothetical protein